MTCPRYEFYKAIPCPEGALASFFLLMCEGDFICEGSPLTAKYFSKLDKAIQEDVDRGEITKSEARAWRRKIKKYREENNLL